MTSDTPTNNANFRFGIVCAADTIPARSPLVQRSGTFAISSERRTNTLRRASLARNTMRK